MSKRRFRLLACHHYACAYHDDYGDYDGNVDVWGGAGLVKPAAKQFDSVEVEKYQLLRFGIVEVEDDE